MALTPRMRPGILAVAALLTVAATAPAHAAGVRKHAPETMLTSQGPKPVPKGPRLRIDNQSSRVITAIHIMAGGEIGGYAVLLQDVGVEKNDEGRIDPRWRSGTAIVSPLYMKDR